MNKLKNEIELNKDLLDLKALSRALQQISYSLKKTEERFMDIEFAAEDEQIKYIRTLLSFKFDIEEILKDWDKLYEKYKNTR